MTEGPARPASRAGPARVVVAGEAFAATAAGVIAERLREAAGTGDAIRGREAATVSLALAGGSTPRPVYRRLASEPDLPWSRVRIFFGDERRVPPDHPESNYRMAREALLSHLPMPPAAVHRMEGEAADPDVAAREYAERLPETLDLLILGIGSDGHTASLFPGTPTLRESRRLVVPATAPVEPRGRLTITPPVIGAARCVIALGAGSGKATAVVRALEGAWDPSSCPAQLARRGLWVLDEAAACGLRERPEGGPETGRLPGDGRP